MNKMVQLLVLQTDPECHNGQRYRQTDRRHYDANSQTYNEQYDWLKTVLATPLKTSDGWKC